MSFPWFGPTEDIKVHDHALSPEEILERAGNHLAPPGFKTTPDNWMLTPLTDLQFHFIYESIRNVRAEKAEDINRLLSDYPPLRDVLDSEVDAEDLPVLTWASPREFERVLDYAFRMKEERDEARLIARTLKGAVTKQGTSKEGVERIIRDVLDLKKRLADSSKGIHSVHSGRHLSSKNTLCGVHST